MIRIFCATNENEKKTHLKLENFLEKKIMFNTLAAKELLQLYIVVGKSHKIESIFTARNPMVLIIILY